MKRIIIAIILISVLISIPLSRFAKDTDNSLPAEDLMTLINGYKDYDGFEVMTIGAFGIYMLKSVMKISAPKEDSDEIKKIVKLIKGIKKMAIVDYNECAKSTKDEFDSKLELLLSQTDLLMETKENSETMIIYGITDDAGSQIRNFVMHSPSEGILICLFGSISIDSIKEIARQK